MTNAPIEWWQWLALLGPIAAPLIIAAATLTAAGIATAVALRTLRQRDLADRKAEWWRHAQWAFDALHSESAPRRELALDVLDVLADSDLPTRDEVALLATTWQAPMHAVENRLDADLVVTDNGDSDGEEAEDEPDSTS